MKTCPTCGFDSTTDYVAYPTLSQAPAGRPCRRHFAGQEEQEALRRRQMAAHEELNALRRQWALDHKELEALRQQRVSDCKKLEFLRRRIAELQRQVSDCKELEFLRQQVAELKSQNEEILRGPEKKRSWFSWLPPKV